MSRFLSCLQHSRPCCIGYTNSRLRLEFVYPIQHGRSCCKHYISNENCRESLFAHLSILKQDNKYEIFRERHLVVLNNASHQEMLQFRNRIVHMAYYYNNERGFSCCMTEIRFVINLTQYVKVLLI